MEAGVSPRTGLDDVERRKILPYQDSNSDPSDVKPVVNHYTDCDLPASTRPPEACYTSWPELKFLVLFSADEDNS
jgi:hypothetical protein